MGKNLTLFTLGYLIASTYAQENIAELAGTAGLSKLVEAVGLAPSNIATLLTSAGSLTVFGPTNDAFDDINAQLTHLTNQENDEVKEYSQPLLGEVLSAHVLNPETYTTAVTSTDLATLGSGSYESAQQPETNLTINTDDFTITTTNMGTAVAQIDTSNVNNEATNGIVHVIESVILPNSFFPKTIEQEVNDTAYLSTLRAAIDAAGLTGTFNDAGANVWTVFAPTDTAFGNLDLTELLNDVETLTKILQAHVMPVACDSTCVLGQTDLETLNENGPTPVSSITAEGVLNTTDLKYLNGYVHVINEVLDAPPSLDVPESTSTPSLPPTESPTPTPSDATNLPRSVASALFTLIVGLVSSYQ